MVLDFSYIDRTLVEKVRKRASRPAVLAEEE